MVFRRNDFLDPGSSVIFGEVLKLQSVATHAKNLARVVAGEFQSVPTLADFLQDKGVIGGAITFKLKATPAVIGYQGAYPVCDATKYAQVFAQVGSRIELIGQIHSVRNGWGANKKPYVFVNFSDWRGETVKLSIWFDGMKIIEPNVPDQSWVGRWLSVSGLVDPPYHGQAKSTRYTHLSITITTPGQIQQLPEQEARFRLLGSGPSVVMSSSPSRNANILESMGKGQAVSTKPIPSAPSRVAPPKSSNQQLLEKMRAQIPQTTRPAASPPLPPSHWRNSPTPMPTSPPKRSSGLGWIGWVFIFIMGVGLLRKCAG